MGRKKKENGKVSVVDSKEQPDFEKMTDDEISQWAVEEAYRIPDRLSLVETEKKVIKIIDEAKKLVNDEEFEEAAKVYEIVTKKSKDIGIDKMVRVFSKLT